MKRFLTISIAALLCGCARNADVIYQGGFSEKTKREFLGAKFLTKHTAVTKLGTISTRADRRVITVLMDDDTHFVAEPSPDAMEQVTRVFEAAGKLAANPTAAPANLNAAMSVAEKYATAVAQLRSTTPAITHFRDASYRLLEARLNGVICGDEYRDLMTLLLKDTHILMQAEIVAGVAAAAVTNRMTPKELPTNFFNSILIPPALDWNTNIHVGGATQGLPTNNRQSIISNPSGASTNQQSNDEGPASQPKP
jgi:hypothetical protein